MASIMECSYVLRGRDICFAMRCDMPIASVIISASRDETSEAIMRVTVAEQAHCTLGTLPLGEAFPPDRIVIIANFADGREDSCAGLNFIDGKRYDLMAA